MTQKKQKSIAVAYFYKNKYSNLLNDIDSLKSYFSEIVLVNLIPDNAIESQDQSLKIINSSKSDLKSNLAEVFKLNLNADYLLILEDNESLVISDELNLFLSNIKNHNYQVMLKPYKSEIHNFEEEVFTVPEKRLILINTKNTREFTDNPDFYFSTELETINPEYLYIEKKDPDYSFEFLKTESLKNNKEKFMLFSGITDFYKQSEKAEGVMKSILNGSENSSYKEVAFMLLLKLYNRKLEYDKTVELCDKYLNTTTNPFCYIYYANALKEKGDNSRALKNYHKAIKLRDNLPFIYNNSDLNWKLYKNLGDIFDSYKRIKYAERYYTYADKCLTERKSPEVLYNLAKINFINGEYTASYNFYIQMFDQEKVPTNLLREAKSSFLNLLLYLSYKEEFTEILSKEVFDKPGDISGIADSFYINGDFESALQLYLLLVNRFGSESRLLFKLGYICSKLHLLEQGVTYFEKYLELVPDDLDALNNIAFLCLNLDRSEQAEMYYLKILEKNNFSFEANLYLAMIYISREDKEKASFYIDRARTLNPVSPELIKLYQILKSELG